MSLPRYRRSPKMRTFSTKEREKKLSRGQVYGLVSIRARGNCEICKASQDPLEPHHVWGRGSKADISTELCELPESILGICSKCHEEAHGSRPELLNVARWVSIEFLLTKFNLYYPDIVPEEPSKPDPLDIARAFTRYMEMNKE